MKLETRIRKIRIENYNWYSSSQSLKQKKRLRRGGKNTQNYTKKVLMTQISTMVWSLTYSQTSDSVKSSGPYEALL